MAELDIRIADGTVIDLTSPLRLWRKTNPDFFTGTALEDAGKKPKVD